MSTEAKVVAVVGVGPGLGSALAVRFARGGFAVALVARRDPSLQPVQAEIERFGGVARSYVADASDEASVRAAFASVREEMGAPEVLLYNAGAFQAGGVLELSATAFEQAWRVNLPVCSEVTHPFALKLTTLAERNWLGRSVSDASAESSKLSL